MLAVVDLRVDAWQIGLLVFLGVICTALSHALFIRGLRFVRAQLASVIACLEPVYGIAFAFFLLHEVPSTATFAGGALIVVTTVAATRRRASV
jgi:drug/metabolite transporter (DMT)-like permease